MKRRLCYLVALLLSGLMFSLLRQRSSTDDQLAKVQQRPGSGDVAANKLPVECQPLDHDVRSPEELIAKKYEEIMIEQRVLEHRLPVGSMMDFRSKQLRLARIGVLNPGEYKAAMHKLFDEILAYRKPMPWMDAAIAKDLLLAIEHPASKHYVLAALLTDDPEMFEMALELYPNNSDVLLASLVHSSRFLTDPEGITMLEAMQPDSPWPSVLRTISDMKKGDIASAGEQISKVLSSELTPFEAAYGSTWVSMSETFQSGSNGNQAWPPTAEGLFRKSSRDLLSDIILGASAFHGQHQDKQGASTFFVSALALAERVSETTNPVVERVALMNQLDILTAIGPEAAQPYLSMPYSEYVHSLESRRHHLQSLIDNLEDD